jgi:hypothetical protein
LALDTPSAKSGGRRQSGDRLDMLP